MISKKNIDLGNIRVARCRKPHIERMETRELLAVFTVTNTGDTGAGSLRQAIIDANAASAASTINFDISGSGAKSIFPKTPLPTLANAITIDGTSQPGYSGTPLIQISGSQVRGPANEVINSNGLNISAGSCTIEGLAINLFLGNGINIQGGGKNVIKANYIGTDLTGTSAFPNANDGIYTVDSRNNTIGGTTAADRNVISGNGGGGIDILSSSNNVLGGNLIEGNYIGTDAGGANSLGNTYDGITLNSTTNNIVGGTAAGAANVIAFNGGDGVKVGNYYASSSQELYNTILSNSIADNGNLGIDLLFGANNPVYGASVTSAYPSTDGSGKTILEGVFNATPNSTYTVQFFSNLVSNYSGAGEGKTLVGSANVTTDGQGLSQFTVTLNNAIDPGTILSATATSKSGATSAFFGNTVVAPTPSANLVISQFASDNAVFSGSTLTYYITARNNGPSRSNGVTVNEIIGGGLQIQSVDTTLGTATFSGNTIVGNLGTMSVGDTAYLTVTLTATTIGSVSNTARINGSTTDPDHTDNTSTIDTQIVANPNPPTVYDVEPTVDTNSIRNVIITFSSPLDSFQASRAINYRVVAANRRGIFNRVVPTKAPVYDEASQTVTITPLRPFHFGTLYEVQINGQGSSGVTDLGGNLLQGNTADGLSGPFIATFSRGYVSPKVRNIGPRTPNSARG